MRLQVLISTMHQKDHSLLDKMNIQSDAIVVNQCDRNEIENFEYAGHNILWMSLNERGVGLSRNTALMRADADIVLFADDDVVYDDGYEKKVIESFEKFKEKDILIFRVESTNKERPTKKEKKDHNLSSSLATSGVTAIRFTVMSCTHGIWSAILWKTKVMSV